MDTGRDGQANITYIKFANLRIFDLLNLFADRPSLNTGQLMIVYSKFENPYCM
jgi:hypothetical protein